MALFVFSFSCLELSAPKFNLFSRYIRFGFTLHSRYLHIVSMLNLALVQHYHSIYRLPIGLLSDSVRSHNDEQTQTQRPEPSQALVRSMMSVRP